MRVVGDRVGAARLILASSCHLGCAEGGGKGEGYFAMDKDTDDEHGKRVVLNRIVTLKEDAGKNA